MAIPNVGLPTDNWEADLLAGAADADRGNDIGTWCGCGIVDTEMPAGESGVLLGPHQAADLDDLLKLMEAGGSRWEVVAVRVVFVLAPAAADTENEPVTGQHLEWWMPFSQLGRDCGSRDRERGGIAICQETWQQAK